jgi:hypothetical protein
MKEFKKNEQGLFVCEECELLCKSKFRLCMHIHKKHNAKQYHDRWIKDCNEGLCKICNNESIFLSVGRGYRTGCCKQHMNDWNHIQINKAIKEKYNVNNVSQLSHVKLKKENSCELHYGSKWGFCIDMKKRSESFKSTMKEKYGVENPSQNPATFKKQQQSRYAIKKYKNSNLWYQGSYEFDFLEKYQTIYDITNAPSIQFLFNNTCRTYYPDFYIASLNLIIECKNSYLAEKDKNKIEEKKKATIANGFKYIMIVDKDYKEFVNLVSSVII